MNRHISQIEYVVFSRKKSTEFAGDAKKTKQKSVNELIMWILLCQLCGTAWGDCVSWSTGGSEVSLCVLWFDGGGRYHCSGFYIYSKPTSCCGRHRCCCQKWKSLHFLCGKAMLEIITGHSLFMKAAVKPSRVGTALITGGKIELHSHKS